jgi:ABC-2 type transport system ATP-binding protein
MIELQQLTKDYGKIKAIEALSFRIEVNEIFGLLGPNGAGKSTTIKILTTLVKPTAGRALLDGIDVVGQPLEIKKRIAVVPQENNLDREMSAFDNLRLYGLLHHIPALESRIEEQLRSVGLWERRNDNILTFSGGMQRRLLIARAVLGQPKVLFLDEPTIGLDPQVRREIWNMIRRIKAQGGTILLTTHYIEEAEALSDRVGILSQGKLIALDTPANLKKMVGEYVVEYADRDGSRVYRMCASREDAQCRLQEAETEVTMRKSNLEDVFVRLTGGRIE